MSKYQAFTVKQTRPVRPDERGAYWTWHDIASTLIDVRIKDIGDYFSKYIVYQKINEDEPKYPTDIKKM